MSASDCSNSDYLTCLQTTNNYNWCAYRNATNPPNPFPTRVWNRSEGRQCFTNVSQYELDMRRKAEILKYKNNTSKLTKKQEWAYINKLKRQGITWANQTGTATNPNAKGLTFLNDDQTTNILICKNKKIDIAQAITSDLSLSSIIARLNSFPTGASNVPPSDDTKVLYSDNNMPLTNFNVVNNVYKAGAEKFPMTAWSPGKKGFPVGKKGSNKLVYA